MRKRRNDLDTPEELTSVQVPKQEPIWRSLDVPPQVTGSLTGLAGFMGLDVKRVAFAEQTSDGARYLNLLVEPRAQGKDVKRRFAEALASGPTALVNDRGEFVHGRGNEDFYYACCGCTQIMSTLETMAHHVDVVQFELSNERKKPVQRPAKRRVTPQHTRR